MMRAKDRIATYLIVALIGTLLQSVIATPAGSVTTYFTKTITVRDSNNNPVQGAIVQLSHEDVSGIGNRWQTLSESATTNSSGVAIVKAPDIVSWINLLVQPPGTSMALYTQANLLLDDESIDVKLSESNLKLNLLRSDGSNPIPGAAIWSNYIGNTILRSGPFGIKLSPEEISSGWLWAGPDQNELTSQTTTAYQIKSVTSGGTTSVQLFTETGTAMVADGSGVYTMRFTKTNLYGTLINPDGTPFIIPEGTSAVIRLWYLSSTGSRMWEAGSNVMQAGDDNWNLQFYSEEQQKYEISVSFQNSLTLGESGGSYLYSNISNRFSLSETGTYTSTLAIPIKVQPTTPTFAFLIKDSTTARNLVNANWSIYGGSTKYGYYSNFPASKGNVTLPNGKYSFELYPANGSKQIYSRFTVLIDGTNVQILDSNGNSIPGSGKVFDLIVNPVDLIFTGANTGSNKAIRSGTSFEFWQLISDGGGSYWNNEWMPTVRIDSVTLGTTTPQGSFILIAQPGSSSGYGRTYFEVKKTGNSYTVNNQSVSVDGNFKIALNPSNFKFKLVDPADSSKALANSWIDFCPQLTLEMKMSGQPLGPMNSTCFGANGDSLGQGSVYLETGTWSVRVSGDESVITKFYTVTVDSSHVAAVTGISADGNGRFVLSPALPNLSGSLFDSSGTTEISFLETQSATVSLQFIDSNGYAQEIDGKWLDKWNKKFNFNLVDQGKYRVLARPSNISDYATSFSQYIYVNGSGQLSLDSTTGFTSSITNLKVNLQPGNFPITVVNPIDQSVLQNYWGYAMPRSGKGSPQYFGTKLGKGAQVNLNFESGSDYVIYIRPFMNPSLADSQYFVSVSSAGAITVTDGSNTINKTNGRYILSPRTTSITGQIVRADGSGLGENLYVNAQLQRFDSKNIWYPYSESEVTAEGLFGFSIRESGNYRVFARPYGDINVGSALSETFTIFSESVTTFTKNFGKIYLTSPHLKFKTKVSGQSAFTTRYGVTLFKDGNYLDSPYINGDGVGALTFDASGSYEIFLNPYKSGDRNVTPKTYKFNVTKNGNSATITYNSNIGISTSGEFTVFEFGSPNLKGTVTNSDSTVAVAFIPVLAVNSVTLEEDWKNYSQSDENGNWSMSLQKGSYKIYARAPGGSIQYANSDYLGDVVVDETGTITSVPAGQTATNFIVKLNAPTWSGVVKNPAGDAVVSYAGVCMEGYSSVYKGNYGWCANSNAQGQWALFKPTTVTLNEDSYLRLYDWNNRQYPDLIVKGKTAIEALIGTSGANKVLKFPSANFELTIKGSGNPVQGAWVSVYDKARGVYAGNSTSANGVAGVYLPNLTGPLDAYIDVPKADAQNSIPSFVSTGVSYTSQQITDSTTNGVFKATVNLKVPNFKGIIRDPANNSTISQSWVEVQNISESKWSPGAPVGDNGTFGLYLAGSNSSSSKIEYIITVHKPWNTLTKSVDKQYKALVDHNNVVTLYDKRTNELVSTETLNSNTLFSLKLQQPNFQAVVREPASNGTPGPITSWSRNDQKGISWAYADLYNLTNQEWVPGSYVAEDGTLVMYLPGGCCRASKEYRLVLQPAWSSTANLVKKEFKVVVDYNDSITVTDARTGNVVPNETFNGESYKTLTLGKPNLSGLVVNKDDTAQAYSWVNINPRWEGVKDYSAKCTSGECWMYSNFDGKFSTNLSDGTYDMYANPMWWGTFQGTQSATCAIRIETGTLTSANNCLQGDGTVKLKLRQPNLSFTLNDGAKAVANAWVSIGIGNFWTSARSDENGFVGLFIDTSTIASGGLTGSQKIRVYVDPPWTSQNMARWNCESGDSKPVCNALSDYTIGTSWTTRDLGTITPPLPNTQIHVIRPDTNASAGWYNYLSVYRINPSNPNNWEWAGWSGTNGEGIATLNIETTTANASWNYKLYISPSWELRNTFTGKMLDNNGAGFTFAQLNSLNFALGTPNLQITSLLPDAATPNKWGYVAVEEVNDSLTVTSWIASDGLNDYGRASFTLPSSKKFRVTIHPGPGRSGTATFCYLQTDGGGAISKITGQCDSGETTTATAMTFTLARGNVIGKITAADGTGIAGAVIYANLVSATNDDSAVIGCSNSSGDYGLILKSGQSYELKIYPINKAGTTFRDKTDLAAITVPGIGTTTVNVTLATS